MKRLSNYSKYVPYLYFIAIITFWFTDINQSEGLTAFPILLFGIPFLWQIIKPNQALNFTLGITFVCLSSYLILAFLFDFLEMIQVSPSIKIFVMYGGIFVFVNFIMALWIIRNSIKRSF